MRWFLRALIFWAVCVPLFYVFALPMLLTKLEAKSRTENYATCQKHLVDEHLAGVPSAVISPAQADTYCHCVSDPITLTKADLFDLMQKKQPTRLAEAMKPVVEGCNATLQSALSQAIDTGPGPHTTYEPDGTQTVHFN